MSESSSRKNGVVPSMFCENSKSVPSLGSVSFMIIIVLSLMSLTNVQVTVSAGSRLIVAVSPEVLLLAPVVSVSTQLTDWT